MRGPFGGGLFEGSSGPTAPLRVYDGFIREVDGFRGGQVRTIEIFGDARLFSEHQLGNFCPEEGRETLVDKEVHCLGKSMRYSLCAWVIGSSRRKRWVLRIV